MGSNCQDKGLFACRLTDVIYLFVTSLHWRIGDRIRALWLQLIESDEVEHVPRHFLLFVSCKQCFTV